MELRIQGFPREIDKLVDILTQVSGIHIERETRNYANRRNNQFRRYVTIHIYDQKPPVFPDPKPRIVPVMEILPDGSICYDDTAAEENT